MFKIYEPISIKIKNSLLGIDTVISNYTSNEVKTTVKAYSMLSDNIYTLKVIFKLNDYFLKNKIL